TRSVKAYELFLQARALVKQADRTGDSSLYDQMLETLKQAIDEDPTFGKAHFSVALFWRGRLELTRQAAKSNSLTLAERYAEFDKAIALAIRHAHNDIERLRYEYLRAWVALDWSLALEKIIAFSEARPAEGCIDLGGVAIRLQRKDIGELAVRNCIEAGKVDIELLQDAVTMSHRVNIDEPIAARLYRANRTRIKNNMAASYQFHRALLWDGEVELARELLPALRSGKGINYRMPILRQACAEGDLDTAREFYELVMTADGDDASSIGEKWLSSQMTGRFDVAEELLRHLDQPDTVFALSSWMYYPQFDPRPYQNLMDMLARNGIEPATPRRETFACPTGVLEP
ncbi:MAG: hypothetical protein R3217_09790, partial [Gammaproteobacteria bacterium]|nr:hypothetical protein [Gammaproteobacteria bacterium]